MIMPQQVWLLAMQHIQSLLRKLTEVVGLVQQQRQGWPCVGWVWGALPGCLQSTARVQGNAKSELMQNGCHPYRCCCASMHKVPLIILMLEWTAS